MSTLALIVFGSFFGFALFALTVGVICQFRDWNNGVSRYDGSPWQYFDTNSQGGRGYVDSSDNYIWIDVPFLDRK